MDHVCTDLDAAVPDAAGGDALAEVGPTTPDSEASAPDPAAIGEPCTSSAACADGLTCARGVCTGSEHGLVPTGNECVIVACRAPEDCCPRPPSSCGFWDEQCKLGYTSYCTTYDAQCVCRASDWECNNDQCRFAPACGANDTCAAQRVCVASKCVECAADSDCVVGKKCVGNACVAACTRDEQCALFHQCQSGTCVWVGCATDRECVTLTSDPLAACLEKNCRKSCISDADCNAASFDGVVCSAGYCYPLGCETDDECRISLAGQLSGNKEAECRPVR